MAACLLLLFNLFVVFGSNCPSFDHKIVADRSYAFTSSPSFSWDQANSLCSACLGTQLADIPNEVVNTYPNTDIHSYWIGQYDGGSLVPYLTWYTGESPAVVVLPSTLSTLRNFVCNSPAKDGIITTPRFAIATFMENLSNISGYIYFQQATFGSKLEVVVNLTGLIPYKTYQIEIHTYGDLRDNCLAIGPIFDVQNRISSQDGEPLTGNFGMLIADGNGCGVRTFNNTRLSLFGGFSVIGRAVLVHLPDYGGDCAVIGFTNETRMNPTPTSNETTISTTNETLSTNTSAPANETTGEANQTISKYDYKNETTPQPSPSPSPMPEPDNNEPSPAPMPQPNNTQPSPSPSTPQPVTPPTLVQKTIVVVNNEKEGDQLGHVDHKLDKIKTVLHHLNHSISTTSAVPNLNNHSNPSK